MIFYHSSTKDSVFVLTETKHAIFSEENLSPTVNRLSMCLFLRYNSHYKLTIYRYIHTCRNIFQKRFAYLNQGRICPDYLTYFKLEVV